MSGRSRYTNLPADPGSLDESVPVGAAGSAGDAPLGQSVEAGGGGGASPAPGAVPGAARLCSAGALATAVPDTVGDPSAVIWAENIVVFQEDGRPQTIATRSDWTNDRCMCAFFLQVTLAVLVVVLVSLSDEDKAQCSKGAQGACASIEALTRAPHSKPAANMETLLAGMRFP